MSKARKKQGKKCPECDTLLINRSKCEEITINGEKFIVNKKLFICPDCGYVLNKDKRHKEIKPEKEDKNFRNKKW
jgi:uncharacterized protein with PIN domain